MGYRRSDGSQIFGVVAIVVLVMLIIALGIWNIWTCTEWEHRPVQRTDCDTYGERFDAQGRAYGGTTRCTTRTVQEAYCVSRE